MAKKKILVADDEAHIRQLIKRALGDDYDVILADNGGEALNIALNERPDIILMDIMMPGLDGYTPCYRSKSAPATRAIPVIMLTGIGYDLNKKLAAGIGADEYITKPFNPAELLDTVKRCETALCPAIT